MLATDFIEKWQSSGLTERAAAQSHFRDLCDLLGEKAPTDADPKGESSLLKRASPRRPEEKAGPMPGGGLFRLGVHEQGEDLKAAFAQLQHYAPALENPRKLVTITPGQSLP